MTSQMPGLEVAQPTSASRWAAVLDLSRIRQALLSIAQPALGAMLAAGGFPPLRTVVLGLVAAGSGFLAVFSLNDVLDRRVDVEALQRGKADVPEYDLDTVFVRHPLARGDLTLTEAVLWVGGLAVVSGVTAAILAPVCLAIFAAAVAFEVLYCTLRRVTWAKTFVSGVMVAVGGLAGWAAVRPLSTAVLPFFVFLALWEIAGRNLPNDLSDLDADSRVGIRTVATVFGPVVSARATLAGAVLTVAVLLFLPLAPVTMVVSFTLGCWALALPGIELARHPTRDQAARYFNRASLLPVLVFAAVVLATVAGR